jgi:ketosteroid isomerase-like protein
MNKIIFSFILFASLGAQSMHHEIHDHSNQDAKSIVKLAYETFGSGDTEAWTALHADDLVFTVFGDIATSGRHIGPSAVIKNVFEPIAVHWPKFTITHKAMYSDGNMVFVHSEMTADGLATETMHMFRVENGLIQSFTAFDDTDSMASADVKQ